MNSKNRKIMIAAYGDPGLEEYRNNPLIATLPPIMEPSEAATALRVCFKIRHTVPIFVT